VSRVLWDTDLALSLSGMGFDPAPDDYADLRREKWDAEDWGHAAEEHIKALDARLTAAMKIVDAAEKYRFNPSAYFVFMHAVREHAAAARGSASDGILLCADCGVPLACAPLPGDTARHVCGKCATEIARRWVEKGEQGTEAKHPMRAEQEAKGEPGLPGVQLDGTVVCPMPHPDWTKLDSAWVKQADRKQGAEGERDELREAYVELGQAHERVQRAGTADEQKAAKACRLDAYRNIKCIKGMRILKATPKCAACGNPFGPVDCHHRVDGGAVCDDCHEKRARIARLKAEVNALDVVEGEIKSGEGRQGRLGLDGLG
jgi:hypothetical protein